MLLLTDTESIEVILKHGLNLKVVPTPAFRPVIAWVLAYYQTSAVAPTIEVLQERWTPDLFADHGIVLSEDVEETIEWAIGDLEGTYVQMQIGLFTRKLATEIGSAPPEERVDRLGVLSAELAGYVLDLQPKTTHLDIREAGPGILAEYEVAARQDGVRGMCLGIPQVDEHFGGIWDGEMFVVGGPAGSGKSFLADYIAHHEWARGRSTTLFTLENSISMTQMRIACCALHLSIADLQNGTLEDAEVQRLREWCNDVLVNCSTPLTIINPEMVNRSPQALVQAARAYQTESLVIDQLTHIEAVEAGGRDKRNEEVAKIVRTLGNLISTGRHQMPCVLLHQVSREGIKAAASTGQVQMTHMAESSEVERSASAVVSLYQSAENKRMGRMALQTLKARRVRSESWELAWEPWQGLISVVNDVDFPPEVLENFPAPLATGVPG